MSGQSRPVRKISTFAADGVMISVRLYLFVFSVILVFGALTAIWMAKDEDARMRTELMVQAKIITAGIDVKKLFGLKGLSSDEISGDYQDLKTQLFAFHDANPLCRFIYITGMNKSGDVFFFVDSEPVNSEEVSPPGQIYKEASDSFKAVFLTGQPFVEGPIPDRWGKWVSALIPIPDPESQKVHAVAGMDVDARDWTTKIFLHCAPAIMAAVFLMTVLTFFFVLSRRAENVRRQISASETRRAESERAYRSIVTNMIDVFFRVNTKNEFVIVSPSAAGLLGYDQSDELIGQNADTFWAEPESRKNLAVNLQLYGAVRDYEMTARRKNGSRLPMSVTIKTIHDDLGNPAGYEGIARDISERKDMEQQLQRAQKMEALGILAGGVAHDLNNVLSGIVSYPDLILMQLPKESELRRPIETIKASGLMAGAIVQDLLTLARRSVSTFEIVNLNQLIADYLRSPEFIKMESFHPMVSLQSDLDERVMNILGSPVHLSKTIMNLVVNAAEAMPDGGAISIRTYNRYVDFTLKGYDHVKEGDYAVLSVSDEGSGILPEDQIHIFEPFFTKKKMGRSGTGLGLAVVWGSVKDHQGYIDVQSTQGVGTTFTLYFPVTRMSDDKSPVMKIENRIKGDGEKILIVDDIAQQREIATAILEQLGYEVTSVPSGEAAVAYLQENRADLVILDMIMDPGIDGLETYEQILMHSPRQKAIITSGYAETDRVKKAQAMGVRGYLKKPYILNSLGKAVKEGLQP